MLTVAICTWNRAEMLAKTLEQFRQVLPPAHMRWELLVVNNNSTDHTDSVIAGFEALLPITRIWQPEPGLSNARNAAIEHARGDYILWTDDDVLVDPLWIRAYEAAIDRHPEVAFFGGPIDPWFENEAPQWILDAWPSILTAFAACDLGAAEIAIRGPKFPFGANFAVRMTEQSRTPFQPALGRRPGGTWIGGEEIQVFARLVAEGSIGYWIPAARVRHWIPEDRQSIRYVEKYFEGLGMTSAMEEPVDGRLKISGVPLWLWRSWCIHEMNYFLARRFRPAARWAAALVNAMMARGKIIATLNR